MRQQEEHLTIDLRKVWGLDDDKSNEDGSGDVVKEGEEARGSTQKRLRDSKNVRF